MYYCQANCGEYSEVPAQLTGDARDTQWRQGQGDGARRASETERRSAGIRRWTHAQVPRLCL